MSLSQKIAKHIAETEFSDLPISTIVATKRAFLDGLGVICGASGVSEEVKPFINIAHDNLGKGKCTIFGIGNDYDALTAALVNGAFAHAIDYEDAFDLAPVHPNASIIPALFALSQELGSISGKEFIAAMALGCDFVCRLGLSLRQPMENNNWYPPVILGAFGAVIACAKLLKLDENQTLSAISLIMCQMGGPGEIKYSKQTTIRAIREAFPAQAAIICAKLAKSGVVGFEEPFEGKAGFFSLFVDGNFDQSEILQTLGKHYYIDDLSFKPWPSCRGTHTYLEIAQMARGTQNFDIEKIKLITIKFGDVQKMLVEPFERKKAPQTSIDAKFSIPYVVARTLCDGQINLDSFSDEELSDVLIANICAKMQFAFQPNWTRNMATRGALSLEFNDLPAFEHELFEAKGHPQRMLKDDELASKFIDCCKRAFNPIDEYQSQEILEQIKQFEKIDDINSIFKIMK